MTQVWQDPRWTSGALAVLVLSALIGVVRLVPPLTETSVPRIEVTQTNDRAPLGEIAYCRANMTDVNCACFGQKAGHVMSTSHTPVRGLAYMDQWDLARHQGGASC